MRKCGMSTHDEAVWRSALERKGRDWVMRELQTRAGRPSDDLLDVTYEPPHPTREFCRRWCGEGGSRGMRFSGLGLAMVLLVVVMVMGGMLAAGGLEHARVTQGTAWMR
jgi:hypothetical protein